jgi:hypothetical protein
MKCEKSSTIQHSTGLWFQIQGFLFLLFIMYYILIVLVIYIFDSYSISLAKRYLSLVAWLQRKVILNREYPSVVLGPH